MPWEVNASQGFFMRRPVQWKFAAKAAHGPHASRDETSPTRFCGNMFGVRGMEKLSGKELTGSVLPPAAGAEGRAAKKFAELEAGRVLVAQAARKAEESREKLEEERLEKKEKEREYRDTPQLSRQSRWFGVEGRQMEEDFRWTLEMEQELWEAFQSWQPLPGGSISGDLLQISRLYLALLEAILTHTTGEEQDIETARLDEVLMEKLNLLMEVRLKNLTEMLGQAGQKNTLKHIFLSLYKRTAGENPDPRRTERFLHKRAQETGGTAGREGAQGSFGGAGSGVRAALPEEGRLYRLSSKGGVEINRDFDIHRKSGEVQMSQRTSALSGKQSFPESELCRAEAFASHLGESTRLFGRLWAPGGNEEAAGFLAALIFMKGQVYASGGKTAGETAVPVDSLIQRLVDYYLNSKGARGVYYYMTDLYTKTGDPQKTAKDGIAYAYRMFREKKEDTAFGNREAYSSKALFFQSLSERAAEENLQKGLRLLEENWQHFQRALGEEEKRGISFRAQRGSSWGMLVETEKRRQEQERKADRTLLRAVLLAAAAGLFFFGWKLFFR